MHQAHLVICRSGASTLAELTALGRVGILVPYPYAVNQHQEKNAAYLIEAGAAFLILNQELTGEKIAAMIEKLRNNRLELQPWKSARESLGPAPGRRHYCLRVSKIFKLILKIVIIRHNHDNVFCRSKLLYVREL